MADLKIKAGAGSTNKLLIQSQDQANNDYAIQVGDAGATTLTNATLTTPTIASMANCTFPAGHIVQTTTATVAGTKTTIATGSSNNNVWTATVVTAAITPIFSTSSIIVNANFTTHIHGEGSSDLGYGFKWKKTGTGIAANTYPSGMELNHNAQGHSNYYRDSFQYQSISNNNQHTLMDNAVGVSGVAVTYTLHCQQYGIDGTFYVGGTHWDNTHWVIFLQEVKR